MHTTLLYPQANGITEQSNILLGDSLRALLLRKGQEEWDELLPQLMRAYRDTRHSATGKTASLMMFGKKLRLQDQLAGLPLAYQLRSLT